MKEAHFNGTPDYAEADLLKAKFTRKEGRTVGLYAEYQLGESQGLAELTAQHHRPPHPDLEACFARLVPHLCFLCRAVKGVAEQDVWYNWHNPFVAEWLLDYHVHEREEFAGYIVTGYSYDDKNGVVLIGQQLLDNGKVFNMIAPREDLAPAQETGLEYPYVLCLARDLGRADEEVKLYLAGKTGPMVVQGELDFNADDDDDDRH